MNNIKLLFAAILVIAVGALVCLAEETNARPIPAGSKVYIAPMENGFHEFLKAAIEKKKVPLIIVDDKGQADFEIAGHSETQKASTAKKVIMWDWRSNEQASIQVVNLKSSEVVFAYSVHKKSSMHGKKSSAEACAKHLDEKIAGSR